MKKKIRSKFLSALFMGLLVISGGFLAMPFAGASQNLPHPSINFTNQNPQKFLQTDNLGLKENFRYPRSSFDNWAVSENENGSVNEAALEAALKDENYESWKEALNEFNGFSSDENLISEEEFKILSAIRKRSSLV